MKSCEIVPIPWREGQGRGSKSIWEIASILPKFTNCDSFVVFYTLIVTARNKTKAKTKTKKQKLRWLALACMAVSNKENFTEGTMSDTAAKDRCFCCVKFKCPFETLLNLIL